MNFGEFKDGKAQQILPPTLAPYEANLDRFRFLCDELCMKLLRLLAFGLRVCDPVDFLWAALNETTDRSQRRRRGLVCFAP